MKHNNIYIVEDMGVTRAAIISVLKRQGYNIIGTSLTAEKAWLDIQSDKVNLIIIDISLKGSKSGLWLAEKIKDKTSIAIIILTAYGDNDILNKVQELEPDGYLMKPFNNPTLLSMIALAFRNIKQKQTLTQDLPISKSYIFLKCTEGIVRINLNEILFVMSDGNYVLIHLEKEIYRSRNKLIDVKEKLIHENLFRIHRRFIVNADKIDLIKTDEILIRNHSLPVSKTFDIESLLTYVNGK